MYRYNSKPIAGEVAALVGRKLKETINGLKNQVQDLQDQIEDIEGAWENWGLKWLVEVGILTQKEADDFDREMEELNEY